MFTRSLSMSRRRQNTFEQWPPALAGGSFLQAIMLLMNVILAADHRGFELKEKLKAALSAQGISVEDSGAYARDPDDDYPDLADAGAKKVAAEAGSFGVFVCGSGMGMDIVANKTKGIRATIVRNEEEAKYARDHDDVNVITLAADALDENAALGIVQVFLETPFSMEEKHRRRVAKLLEIENKNFR